MEGQRPVITGATAATLTVPPASVGQTITVQVTGTKTGYDPLTKDSAPTAAVTDTITRPDPDHHRQGQGGARP